jgi:pimeloyl-ACP methyl ester carboxylesterase
MPTTPELRFFNTGEIAIHFAEWNADPGNDTPTFLFMHGITGRHETWYELADAIRNGARAIAIDLRGHGRSGHSDGAYRLPDYARDVAALIDGLKLGPVIAIGHSLGGLTALQLAHDRPDLTSALVLEDPPLYGREIMESDPPGRHERFRLNAELSGSGLTLSDMAKRISTDLPFATEDAAQQIAHMLFVTDADAIAHVYDGRLDWSGEIEAIMQSVQCPVFLMRGNPEFGAWMRLEDEERARRLIPDCETAVWDDIGHLLHSNQQERFIEQVRKFVARIGFS